MQVANRRRWVRGIWIALLVWGAAASTTAQTPTFQGYPVVQVRVNDQPLQATVPPIIVENITLVPLRAMVEALGLKVGWDEATRTVLITGAAPAEPAAVGETADEQPGRDVLLDEIAGLKATVERLQAERDDLQNQLDGLSESKQNWMTVTEKVATEKAAMEADLARLQAERDKLAATLDTLEARIEAVQTENRSLAKEVQTLKTTLSVAGTNSPAGPTPQPLPLAASERGVAVTVSEAEETDGGLVLDIQVYNGSTRPLIVLQNQFRLVAGAQQYRSAPISTAGGQQGVLGGEVAPGTTRSGRVLFPDVPAGTSAARLLLKFGSESAESPYIISMDAGTAITLYTIKDPWDMNLTLRLSP